MRTSSIAVLSIAACLLLTACPGFHSPEAREATETRNVQIDLGKAELVQVEVQMGAGELRMTGGAGKLMEADFRYGGREPEVRYNDADFRGVLTVKQSPAIHGKNEWDIRLNDKVALDLNVKLGAGEARLNFASLSPRNVEVELGAGKLDLDLDGDYRKDMDVNIRGGVGEANVYLPRGIGVIATAKGGIGEIQVRGLKRNGDEYTNEAYRDSKVTMRVDVRGGIGQIKLISK